jgi:DHA1 family multidrug resistance protein-like MFS transporter
MGFCFEAGADEDTHFRATSLETLRNMVAAGSGITLLPALAVPRERKRDGVVYLPCIGLRQFVQQGLGIFGGAIADRFGAKPMIVTGMLLRAAGFATMGIAHEPWLLWVSCFISGLGGTLFDPPRTALVVKLIRPQQRGRFFSLLMMQDSAGAVVGALLGSWLLQYDFRLVCAVGAVLFVLCAGFNAWLLPAWKLSTVKAPVREGMGR